MFQPGKAYSDKVKNQSFLDQQEHSDHHVTTGHCATVGPKNSDSQFIIIYLLLSLVNVHAHYQLFAKYLLHD